MITLVIAFTIHEFSHAFVATRFGDPTPEENGRLTLNPLKHLDVFGSLMLLLVGFGWAKPVPIRPDILLKRSKAGVMLVSFSGPFSNFLLAVLGALLLAVFRMNTLPGWLSIFLGQFIWINLSLMIFNLIPLAPLDGEEVLEFFIPQSARDVWDKIQEHGAQILLVVFLILPYLNINVFGKVLSPLIRGIYLWLVGG